MKIADIITEARVEPDKEIMAEISELLDTVNPEYQQYLDDNGDVDDIDELGDLLNDEAEMMELDYLQFFVNHEPRPDPNETISAMASWEGDTKGIDIYLHAKNLENKWGPQSFKDVILKAIAHETIHFGQYEKMGKEKLGKTLSGHQKGTRAKENGGTERDWQRMYLRDPHELMAYAHDLAGEIKDEAKYIGVDSGEILRKIEQYKGELPVYNRFRSIFHKEAPQIRNLLKYVSQYI